MTPKRAAILISLMGWGFIIFGVVFVTIAFPAFDSFAKVLSYLFDWTGQTTSDSLSRSARWFAAIMSGMSAGLGAFFVFIVAPLLSHKDNEVFRRWRSVKCCDEHAVLRGLYGTVTSGEKKHSLRHLQTQLCKQT